MIYMTRTALLAACAAVLSAASFISAQTKDKSERYPNELLNFRFYQTAKWKSLVPLVSTMTDVRKVLGEPSEANDTSQFTKPYPGDDKAKNPVFEYKFGSDWLLLIYFVKYCFHGYVPLPKSLDSRLCSIDLVPNKPISFSGIVFPEVFKKTHVDAIDGRWDEYTDDTGLSYQVYTGPPANGKEKAGDLERIVYTASKAEFEAYSTKANN